MALSYLGYTYKEYRVEGNSVMITVGNDSTGDAFSISLELNFCKTETILTMINELKKAIDSRVALLSGITAQKTVDQTEESNLATKMGGL